MSVILAWLLHNPAIIGIVAAFAAALGFGFQQRKAGAKAEKAKQAAEELNARKTADQVDNDVSALTPAQQRERLGKWAKS